MIEPIVYLHLSQRAFSSMKCIILALHEFDLFDGDATLKDLVVREVDAAERSFPQQLDRLDVLWNCV